MCTVEQIPGSLARQDASRYALSGAFDGRMPAVEFASPHAVQTGGSVQAIAMPRVVVIVLNWNGCEDTLACLESLAQVEYPAFEVLMVDNGSTDGSVGSARSCFPKVTIIETGENLGYAGGNNVGLQWVLDRGADYALLLNNDTEVASDFLRLLVEAAEADPAIGVVGPTIYYYDQPQVIWSAGGSIDWKRGSTRSIGLDEVDKGQYDKPRDVDFVAGCALLVRRQVVEKVGTLDPRFFMYYEETEWCVRIARAGYRILHVPYARLWHKIPPGQTTASPRVTYYMTRNRLLFLRSTRAGLGPWLYTLLAGYLRTLVSLTLRSRWCHQRAKRRAMALAIIDFACGRLGRAARA